MKEDSAAILRAPIGTLTVLCSRVVVLPEYVEQSVIGDLCRIELHFDYFGVAGGIRTNIFVGRILCLAACIANRSGSHAWDLAKSGFYSPEASGAESGFFSLVFHVNLDVFQRVWFQTPTWLQNP